LGKTNRTLLYNNGSVPRNTVIPVQEIFQLIYSPVPIDTQIQHCTTMSLDFSSQRFHLHWIV